MQDEGGNLNAAATSPAVNYLTPLTVTINKSPSQADPTSQSPINFRVVFSRMPRGAHNSAGDILKDLKSALTLGGTAGATAADVTYAAEVLPYDGTIYNVAVSGMTSPGTVTVSLGADIIKDWNDIFNKPSTSDDNTVTYAP